MNYCIFVIHFQVWRIGMMGGNSTTEDVDRILRYLKDALEVVGKGEDWMWTDKILVFEYCGWWRELHFVKVNIKMVFLLLTAISSTFILFLWVGALLLFLDWSLSDNFKTSRIRLYADDTKVYREIKDVRRDSQALESDLNSLDKWAKTWQIGFNLAWFLDG